MKKVEKQFVQEAILKQFGVELEFYSRKAAAVGYCTPKESCTKIFVTSSCCSPCDTIAHEIAHLRQYEKRGETICMEMSNRKERESQMTVIKEHQQITKSIFEEMKNKKEICKQFGLIGII